VFLFSLLVGVDVVVDVDVDGGSDGGTDNDDDDDDGGGGDDDDILRSHTINNLLCAHTISLAELQSTTM